MNQGYVSLDRYLLSSELWLSEPFTRGQAWVDLIMLANWKPGIIRKRGIKIELKRGHVGRSQLTLAERWKWSRGKVKRFLDELETEQQIEQQITKLTTLIYIVNYDKYQSRQTEDSTTDGQQTDIKRYSNNNNNNNNNKQNTTSPAKADDDQFEIFWGNYKKKVDRKAALAKFKLLSSKDQQIAIDDCLPRYANTEKQYVPSPRKYLLGELWNDELIKNEVSHGKTQRKDYEEVFEQRIRGKDRELKIINA